MDAKTEESDFISDLVDVDRFGEDFDVYAVAERGARVVVTP